VEVGVVTAAAIVAVAVTYQRPILKYGDNGQIGATPVVAISGMTATIVLIPASANRGTRMTLLTQTPWMVIHHEMGFGTSGAIQLLTDHLTNLSEIFGVRIINVVTI
jgi:hypothetical protein